MKRECDVIRDLLPLYAEKLASPASSALVELGLVPQSYPFSCTGISGYSGGGKMCIRDRSSTSALRACRYGSSMAENTAA